MANHVVSSADIKPFGKGSAAVKYTWVEPNSSDVVYCPNTDNIIVLIDNESASNQPTLTFATPNNYSEFDLDIEDYVFTCPTGKLSQIGGFSHTIFNTATDDATSPSSLKITVGGTVSAGELKLAFVRV